MFKKSDIKEGTWFIDLNKDYAEVKLIMTGKNPRNNNILSIMWYNFPDEPTIIELTKYSAKVFPDVNGRWTKIEGVYLELKKIHNSSRRELKLKIYNSLNKKITVQEVLDFYKSKNVSKTYREALLKLDIAKGELKYEKLKSGEFVELSDITVHIENKKRFLQSIATEITAKSDRVELLIHHSQTKGNYRELLLRGILKKYIPNKYEIATGFIEDCKRQCDIIIYDAHNFSPLFREDELVVVPKKSVRAVIEVKSTLDSGALHEGLELLQEVSKKLNFPAPVFKGIFAFKEGFKNYTCLVESIHNFYNKKDALTGSPGNLGFLLEEVNAFCVVDKQCIITDLIDYKQQDLSIYPRLYSINSDNDDMKLYCAAFFNELFTFLDMDHYAKKDNVNYFDTLDYEIKYKMEKELYNKDWKPRSGFVGEHDFSTDSIWGRVSDIINWKAGNIRIRELEEKYSNGGYSYIDYRKRFADTINKKASQS